MKRILSTLSHKWHEYLLEILVITIGILGAFALSNWNESRLEKIEEKKILLSVKNDLINAKQEFVFLNTIRNQIISSSKEIYEIAHSGIVEKNQIDSLLSLTLSRPTFNNKLGSVDLLFNSGKINLIRDDTIKARLIAWPGSVDDMSEEETYAIKSFQDYYFPLLARYVVIEDLMRQFQITSFFGTKFTEEPFPDAPINSDYAGLLKNKNFLNHLRARVMHMQITVEESKDLISEIDDITNRIDQALEE